MLFRDGIFLELVDLVVARLPKLACGPCRKFGRKPLAVEKLRMHADHQHLFVVRAIEDGDLAARPAAPASAARESGAAAPRRVGALKLWTRHALRIDARHHVLDRAILAGRVERLKDDDERVLLWRPKARPAPRPVPTRLPSSASLAASLFLNPAVKPGS